MPTEMRPLFQNPMANSLKFRAERPPEIRTSAERQGDRVRVSVSDDGIGFQERDREGIFLVFKRLHRREAYSGTGIGLAICKKIVEAHGGDIEARAEPGRGATFTFTLPAVPTPNRSDTNIQANRRRTDDGSS